MTPTTIAILPGCYEHGDEGQGSVLRDSWRERVAVDELVEAAV